MHAYGVGRLARASRWRRSGRLVVRRAADRWADRAASRSPAVSGRWPMTASNRWRSAGRPSGTPSGCRRPAPAARRRGTCGWSGASSTVPVPPRDPRRRAGRGRRCGTARGLRRAEGDGTGQQQLAAADAVAGRAHPDQKPAGMNAWRSTLHSCSGASAPRSALSPGSSSNASMETSSVGSAGTARPAHSRHPARPAPPRPACGGDGLSGGRPCGRLAPVGRYRPAVLGVRPSAHRVRAGAGR